MPLKEAVDATNLFIATTTVKVQAMQIMIMTRSKRAEEIGAEIKECSAMCREALNRMKTLIRRFECEVPESPRIVLESSLSKLMQLESELEEYVAFTTSTNSEKASARLSKY
jgi:signal transduction histidine kinase